MRHKFYLTLSIYYIILSFWILLTFSMNIVIPVFFYLFGPWLVIGLGQLSNSGLLYVNDYYTYNPTIHGIDDHIMLALLVVCFPILFVNEAALSILLMTWLWLCLFYDYWQWYYGYNQTNLDCSNSVTASIILSSKRKNTFRIYLLLSALFQSIVLYVSTYGIVPFFIAISLYGLLTIYQDYIGRYLLAVQGK